MKQDEFDRYLKNLVQEVKRLNTIEGVFEKAGFQGAIMGFLACDKEHTFTGKQVAEIINTALNYKSPGNEGSAGAKVKILQEDYTSNQR